jgi:hypothetical protein
MLFGGSQFHGKEAAMEIRMQSHEGSVVGSPSETIRQFEQETRVRQREWLERLSSEPDTFSQIEHEIDEHYRNGGGRLTAALLQQVTSRSSMDEHVERIRQDAVIELKSPEKRPLRVRLLCGLLLFVTTSYCAPRRNKKSVRQSGDCHAGLYPELAAFGFGKGCSPALQYTVARIVALSPSIEVARKELSRQGIRLDKKTVRGIAEQLGVQLLALRRRELLAWRLGQLSPGNDLAGRRVVVQIDGGRIRLRENKKRPASRPVKKNRRRKFSTPWREPKVLTIFEIDDHGKMVKKHNQPLIDGTLLGPDHLVELVAYHLHRLGAAKAALVVFVSDGAPWIWDRLDWIERRVGLDSSHTVHVLDFCHAAHHISLALGALSLPEKRRRKLYGNLRKLLKRSRYDKVVQHLRRLARGQPDSSDVWREIRYLQKHGKQGHLNYATFRRRGIPCGSGAVESAIRRVINLRLKSNAMYWLAENAEAIFAVRATLLCDRWEETLARLRKSMRRDRRLDWTWIEPDVLTELKSPETIKPPVPQHATIQQPKAAAA